MSEALAPRVALVVCDSFGVGGAPDAAAYGDEGSNTLGNTSRAVGGLHAPNLERLGLGSLTEIEGVEPRGDRGTVHGVLTERSAGKDTTTGHWELAGVYEKLEESASAIAEYELYLKATKWHSDVYPWRIPMAQKKIAQLRASLPE